MYDEKKLPAEPTITNYKWGYRAGFGLWWLCLLVAGLMPDADMSERARMYLFIGAMVYAVVLIASMYWSGYSKAVRAMTNEGAGSKKEARQNLLFSAIGWVISFFVLKLVKDIGWLEAAISALIFSGALSLWMYLTFLKKPQKPAA